MSIQKIEYYIHPVDSYTSQIIAHRLGISDEENDLRCCTMHDKNGQEVRCYELPNRQTAREFLQNRCSDRNLHFILYSRLGDSGPVNVSSCREEDLQPKKIKRKKIDPRKIPGVTTASK